MTILAVVMAGFVNLSITGKRFILRSRNRGSGGVLGRMFLDPLQMGVRQDTWGGAGNPLTAGTYYCDSDGSHTQHPSCPSGMDRRVNNVLYDARYDISNISTNGLDLRKVELILNWEEVSP